MIDIHAHILPGVDDGSPDMLDALLLAKMAVESGVTAIIATPHSHAHRDAAAHLENIRAAYGALRAEIAARGIPLELRLGMEILCRRDLAQRFREGTVLSLNGTDRYLIEFPFEEDARACRRYIELVREQGGRPVIAHPERYRAIQKNPELAVELCEMGCLLQASADFLRGGRLGRERRPAKLLIKRGLYSYVASDAHNVSHYRDLAKVCAKWPNAFENL